jgi:hypothetical protein
MENHNSKINSAYNQNTGACYPKSNENESAMKWTLKVCETISLLLT